MQAANFSKTQVFMFKHEIHPHEQTQMGWVVIFLSAMTLCWLLTRTDSQGTFPAAPQPHHIYAHPRQSHPAEGQPAGPCSCTVVHPEPSSDRGEQPQESLSFAAQGALATSASASTSSAFQKVRVQHGMRCELPVPWQRQRCLLLSATQPLPLPCCWAQLAAARAVTQLASSQAMPVAPWGKCGRRALQGRCWEEPRASLALHLGGCRAWKPKHWQLLGNIMCYWQRTRCTSVVVSAPVAAGLKASLCLYAFRKAVVLKWAGKAQVWLSFAKSYLNCAGNMVINSSKSCLLPLASAHTLLIIFMC